MLLSLSLLRRLVLGISVVGCAVMPLSKAGAQTRKLKIVASFSILGDFIRQVGADRVDVTILVGPDGDAHVYEPKPADSAKIANADLVVLNGLGFEPWADRLLRASNISKAPLIASEGVKPLTMEGGLDPHAFQNVDNARLYVANIAKALAQIDPAGQSEYEAGLKDYLARLDGLNSEVKTTFAGIPQSRRKVVTSHDAMAYFGDAYGIAFYAPQGLSTQAEASARNVGALIRQIKTDGISAVFVENMSDKRLINQIAKETGAKGGGTLYSDALARSGEGATYIGMIQHNTRLLAQAMQ